MDDDFFAPPAFKPAEAITGLKRQLRDLKLTERGDGFELRGQPVVQLGLADDSIAARLARRPARMPEWTAHTLKSSADLRRFADAVRQALSRWTDDT